jgi:hypothetical protein
MWTPDGKMPEDGSDPLVFSCALPMNVFYASVEAIDVLLELLARKRTDLPGEQTSPADRPGSKPAGSWSFDQLRAIADDARTLAKQLQVVLAMGTDHGVDGLFRVGKKAGPSGLIWASVGLCRTATWWTLRYSISIILNFSVLCR